MLVFLTDTREATCGQNTRHNGLLRVENTAELAAGLQDRWAIADEVAAAMALLVVAGARVSFTTVEPSYLHFDVSLSAAHPHVLPERIHPSVVEPLPTPGEEPTW